MSDLFEQELDFVTRQTPVYTPPTDETINAAIKKRYELSETTIKKFIKYDRFTDSDKMSLKPDPIDMSEMKFVELKNDINDFITGKPKTFSQYLKELYYNPHLAMILKVVYDEFIQHDKTHIAEYNKIFNDRLYDIDDSIILNETEMANMLKEYNEHILNKIKQRNINTTPQFEENEIVGAKDSEGRWWMSRVLKTFRIRDHIVYYVEFLNWGEKFNTFITEPSRIRRFNPYKHTYYRSAWKLEAIKHEVEED